MSVITITILCRWTWRSWAPSPRRRTAFGSCSWHRLSFPGWRTCGHSSRYRRSCPAFAWAHSRGHRSWACHSITNKTPPQCPDHCPRSRSNHCSWSPSPSCTWWGPPFRPCPRWRPDGRSSSGRRPPPGTSSPCLPALYSNNYHRSGQKV